MFKSVFSKYVTAFMLIIVVSFLVVLVVTAAAIGRFSASIKEETVKRTVESTESYFSSLLYSADIKDLYSFDDTERDNVKKVMKNLSPSMDDVSTIVVDTDGKILFSYFCEGNQMLFEGDIPANVIEEIKTNGSFYGMGEFDGIFSGANTLSGTCIVNRSGEICGYVFACSDSFMMADLWELMVKIIMGSILWVLLAALIAVYFISERVIAPLRAISNAAKKFAKGKFDVRVPVRGSDEVSELAETFNQMAESLNNYDNMRNTFMSDVSHDLRSPMTSIAGFIDGILDGVIPPDQHKY